MSKDERFDIVIIGGGPNGMTTAAYLAKCGISVCVLEERTECGGACETQEPIPGVRIFPHAMLMYAAPAPGFEQLELWRYGFRMNWDPEIIGGPGSMMLHGLEGWLAPTDKDLEGWATLGGMFGSPPYTRELMRATFWSPPHPPEVEITDDNVPYMQVYKEHQPEIWSHELREKTMFDVLDEYCETEHFKTTMAYAAWASGAAAHWEGVAIPAIACSQLLVLTNTGQRSLPRGGLHAYFHAIHRCAVHHGAVVRTQSPVDEIIVDDGRAVGVRLRETAASGGKKIWASKAVISGCDVHQTFLDLVGPKHLDPSFVQNVKDISLKNQTLYVSTYFTKKPMRYKEKYKEFALDKCTGPNNIPNGCVYPTDTRDFYYADVADVDGRKTRPSIDPKYKLWFLCPSMAWDPTDCQGHHPKGHLTPAFEMALTSPDYHLEGEDAIDTHRDEIGKYMTACYSQVFDGLDDDNVIHHWFSTGRDVEFRNTGLIGGTWCGSRHCEDQLWENRPCPGLERYRSPIEGLYHAHQTSGHPGALCLMAIPYNLMHILIEDGVAEPGKWWYPSPWYIPQEGKISADASKKSKI
ncbi:MAG: NAD(P)/FAD-dependent oxidoreductase [Deltaproteobacteria bacterium]|nr:NAD(P)/FAD-dependent oxidoreductase [Deltaproteobacteria bacterium]